MGWDGELNGALWGQASVWRGRGDAKGGSWGLGGMVMAGWWVPGGSQLGMLMPAGMPEPAKVRTSREVKSGVRNLSFSKAGGQGSSFSSCSALATSRSNLALMALFTMATKPAEERGPWVGRARPPTRPIFTHPVCARLVPRPCAGHCGER